MKLKCVIKNILLAMLFVFAFFLGLVVNKVNTELNAELDRRPKQLAEKRFIDIGEVGLHNKAVIDFFLKYRKGDGFAALRQEHIGFEGPIVVYLITDDGKFTGLLEEKGLFANSYKEIKPKSLKIGYEDLEGNFTEIDPENYEGIDLEIIIGEN